jgi:hypothetical protein
MSGASEKNEIRELGASVARELAVMVTESRWATRFVWAAIIHGILAAGIAVVGILAELLNFNPTILEAIEGRLGVFLVAGFLAYVTIGILGMAVSALFYQYLEVNLRAPYGPTENSLAWIHLLLANIGAVGATWSTIIAAYFSSNAASLADQQAEFAKFEYLIITFAIVLIVGLIAGGLGYLRVYGRRQSQTE